jgi:hypothetical protein
VVRAISILLFQKGIIDNDWYAKVVVLFITLIQILLLVVYPYGKERFYWPKGLLNPGKAIGMYLVDTWKMAKRLKRVLKEKFGKKLKQGCRTYKCMPSIAYLILIKYTFIF